MPSESHYFNSWGEFYIEQLIRALNQQIKPNFKDKACFLFGGDYFNSIVDKSSDIFDSMPPPTPSNQLYNHSYTGLSPSSYSPQPSNMSVFNNQSGGCFGKSCLITLDDNSLIEIKDLEKGMIVKTFDPNNNYKECTTRVVGLIKINFSNEKEIINFINTNLQITSYHPIYDEDKKEWVFPVNKNNSSIELIREKYVYNVVLEDYHIMEVNTVKCITLGHSYNFDVLSHPYFGSKKVIDDLNSNSNFKLNGFLEINDNNIIRDDSTKLINKIIST